MLKWMQTVYARTNLAYDGDGAVSLVTEYITKVEYISRRLDD